ncbi:hypothetical protein B0A53_00731 [Rhodotorula sp. CCFEE 5036]|nr:hypothetical protein B0A53_00731 [Rhodotorula sp. CCFEE 5036]
MTRTRADSFNSSDPSDSEPHHADADALARLERLLEAQLAPDSSAFYSPPEDTGAPPAKKKKLDDEATATETRPDEAAQPGQSATVAFRLFSTQKQPQRVVLRTESTPPPVVLDTRIRDVQDEDPEQVEARRKAIASVAVDGQAVRAQAATLPSPHPPSYRLSHRVLTPSSYRATKTLQPAPTLIYLDACLPRPLLTLSPFPVPAPEDTEPPKTPHQGLLALPPFEDVYKRRWQETKRTAVSGSGPKGDGKKKKAAVKEEEEGRLPRMPKRNRAFELGDGTGHGPLRLSVIYPPPPSPAPAATAVHSNGKSVEAAGPSSNGKASSKGKRLSKARRTREQRRRKQAAAALGV